MNNIEIATSKFKIPKNFKKYAAIGVFVWFTGMFISTTALYIGIELFNLPLLYLNPFVYGGTFIYGFGMKYLLYNTWDMLK